MSRSPSSIRETGNAGPARNDLGDFILGDAVAQQLEIALLALLSVLQLLLQFRNLAVLQFRHPRQVLRAPRRVQFGPRPLQFLLDVRGALHGGFFGLPDFIEIGELALHFRDLLFQFFQALDRGLVGFLFQRLALDLLLDQLPLQAIQRFRLGIDFHADPRGRFVHQVDGLVRQLPVADVAVRQRRRRHQGRVGDVDAVVHLVALLQAAQDGDGVLHGGLADVDLLETALQRGVLLHVLAVFVQRGRADAVQFAARQCRLEHVARIHRAFGLAGADHGVQLVDEQDDIAFLLGQVVQHGLQALFEFPAVLGAGQQRAHVEVEHALAPNPFGNLVIDDALGQAFDDGGLAHARLADQHRVVLGAALQHLDAAADFLVAADDRIELALLGPLGQVDGVFFQRLAVLLGIGVHDLLAAAHLVDRFFDRFAVGAGLLQDIGQRALDVQRRQDKQFAGDVLVAARLGQLVGYVQDLDTVVGEADLTLGAADARQAVQPLAELRTQLVDAHARPGSAGGGWRRRPGRAAPPSRAPVRSAGCPARRPGSAHPPGPTGTCWSVCPFSSYRSSNLGYRPLHTACG